MASINLPKEPKGKEFEEYISSLFQSRGDYIERNVVERITEEVFELDIITTDYSSTPPNIKLVEVKSGDWGYPDLFKLRGWMDYLKISKGIFVVKKENKDINLFKTIAQELSIEFIIIEDPKKPKDFLYDFLHIDIIDDADISTWRSSYWVERNLLNLLTHKKKSNPDIKRYNVLDEYYCKVNSETFFTENIYEKVFNLYSIFQKFPRISAKCGNEINGNDFDEDCNALPTNIYEDTYYKASNNDIQISTFIEHRARLAILKNAIDYRLYKISENTHKTQDNIFLKIPQTNYELKLSDLLPTSFKEGLNSISQHKFFHKYPVFWQWFMWIFGGFILLDYKDEEYKILSEKTGIPINEIQNALESYQILFPRDGGWFIDLSPSSNI